MRFRPAALAAALLVAGTGLIPVQSASAAPTSRTVNWAPAADATIYPGMATSSDGAGCTANYVFTDKAGGVYIGQAAHCTSTSGDPLSGSGCATESTPLGTSVTLGEVTGTLAYSSWVAMQKAGETDEVICRANDFALIKVPAAAISKVNPSVPLYGGPVGVSDGMVDAGESVYGYGSSDLRAGLETPQRGFGLTTEPGGWYHVVYLLPPGVPGDSGGGLMDADGRGFGVLISLNTLPPGTNGVTDLGKALAYAQKYSGIKGLELVPGTESFSG